MRTKLQRVFQKKKATTTTKLETSDFGNTEFSISFKLTHAHIRIFVCPHILFMLTQTGNKKRNRNSFALFFGINSFANLFNKLLLINQTYIPAHIYIEKKNVSKTLKYTIKHDCNNAGVDPSRIWQSP